MKKHHLFVLALVFVALISLFAGCSAVETDTKTFPDAFAIYFSCWINESQKNILDTYEGYIQKDLVELGVATTEYSASDEVLKSIYEQIGALDLTSIERVMTSKVLTTDDTGVAMEPCTYYEIRFTIDGTEYRISGDATAWYYEDSDAASFTCFVEFMNDLMRSSEEYQSLPDAEGGYL